MEAYQRSMKLLVDIHELCKKLPPDEKYELISQMRRASKSIPAAISEGFGRKTSEKEFKHYMRMAMGSANEMETHLRIAGNLGYITDPDLSRLTDGFELRTSNFEHRDHGI